jgi:ribosomal protein L40E
MEVRELVCGNCGAINRASAGPCWRCLEPLERPELTGASIETSPAIHHEDLGSVRVCSRCKAENAVDVPFCWRCQAPFARLSLPTEVSQPRVRASFAAGAARPARRRTKTSAEALILKITAGAAALVTAAWLVAGRL